MHDSSQPQPIKNLRGVVRQSPTGKGSKSEHNAFLLETKRGRFILRRKQGPAYGDVELEQYLDCAVECDGFIVGTTLLAELIKLT